MPEQVRVMIVIGTRQEAVKMSPVVLEMKTQSKDFETVVVTAGKQEELLGQVMDVFRFGPDDQINTDPEEGEPAEALANSLKEFNELIKKHDPDLVLLHGNTPTSVAAGLAAYYNRKKTGLVEAGLRTWDKFSSFPSEMHRQLTCTASDIYFAPTDNAMLNLVGEGKKEERIFVTGNTAIDALKWTMTEDYKHELLDDTENKRVILLTAHREENLGQPMENIFSAVTRIADEHEDVKVIYPVHKIKELREQAEKTLGDHPRIVLTEPFGLKDFHNLAAKSDLILTDSGGVQEEAGSLNIPVLVLRDATERPEGIDGGTVKLTGTDEEPLYDYINTLLTDSDAYTSMKDAPNPFGDGQAAERITEAIKYFFEKQEERPQPFKVIKR